MDDHLKVDVALIRATAAGLVRIKDVLQLEDSSRQEGRVVSGCCRPDGGAGRRERRGGDGAGASAPAVGR